MTNYTLVTIIGAITAILIAGVAAIGYTTQSKSQLMAKDIQTALEKGVNPIVIRCAYADEADRICLVYAAAQGDEKRVDLVTKPLK